MIDDNDPYVWRGSAVLRNRFGILDASELEQTEREVVLQRIREGCPTGSFDRRHLQAIHRHLFQDVYDWAGSVRTLNISKGGSHFIPHQFIDTGLADVYKRIEGADYLRGLTPKAFATAASEIVGDVNYVHPFREGNGRTQFEYLRQLGERAGHVVDLATFDQERWIEASKRAQDRDYSPMAEEIRAAIKGRDRDNEVVAAWERFGDRARMYDDTSLTLDQARAADRGTDRER